MTRAYNDARHRGLLEARVGQGPFVSEPTARSAADIADAVGGTGEAWSDELSDRDPVQLVSLSAAAAAPPAAEEEDSA